jgi:hypothetical protein
MVNGLVTRNTQRQGDAARLSRNLLVAPESELGDGVSQSLSKRMSDMLRHQANLIEVAQATQVADDNDNDNDNDSHHKSNYTPGFTEFLTNCYVLYNKPEGRFSKLAEVGLGLPSHKYSGFSLSLYSSHLYMIRPKQIQGRLF